MCKVISGAVGKGGLLWPVCSLGKILLVFTLLHFVLQGQTCLLFWISLYHLLLHSNPLWWKGHLFLMLVLEGLVVFNIIGQLQLLLYQWLGHRFGLLWYWIFCLGNEPRSFCVFEIAPKYCILDTFVDCESYFFSSKGFLPTVVDIMVIWVKFTHSCPF